MKRPAEPQALPANTGQRRQNPLILLKILKLGEKKIREGCARPAKVVFADLRKRLRAKKAK